MKTHNDRDGARAPLSFAGLGPSARWVARLPALGAEAARRQELRRRREAAVTAVGRWFVPLAAGVTVACWLASAHLGLTDSAPAALLLTATESQARVALAVGAAP